LGAGVVTAVKVGNSSMTELDQMVDGLPRTHRVVVADDVQQSTRDVTTDFHDGNLAGQRLEVSGMQLGSDHNEPGAAIAQQLIDDIPACPLSIRFAPSPMMRSTSAAWSSGRRSVEPVLDRLSLWDTQEEQIGHDPVLEAAGARAQPRHRCRRCGASRARSPKTTR
jgi:hypothetical protein